jgi:hypothetical protein
MAWFRRDKESTSCAVDVGWVIDPNREPTFIWGAPHRLSRPETKTTHSKGVSICPAINEHESRLYEVCAPVDLHLRFKLDQRGDPAMTSIDGEMSSIRPQFLSKLMMAVHPAEWRHPKRPMIQVMTPYLFVADEPVYMTMFPAIYHYPEKRLPGMMLGGRFPIHIWPRELVWAFEWYDTASDILIDRGDPWFYVGFEAADPSRRVRLIEAEMTPQLREYSAGIRGITNYISHPYSLIETAKQRRPEKLLTPKVR